MTLRYCANCVDVIEECIQLRGDGSYVLDGKPLTTVLL